MSSQMLLKATLLLLFGISFLNVLYLPSPLIMYSRTRTGLLSWNRETISKQINFHDALKLLKSDSHCTVQ